jgi:hypothetical protein
MENLHTLNKKQHSQFSVLKERSKEHGDTYMAAATFPDEFPHIHHKFPIIFQRGHGDDNFNCLALLGLKDGENLFVDTPDFLEQRLPLSFEVLPFMISRSGPEADEGNLVFDPSHPRIQKDGKNGERLFEDDGNQTEFLQNLMRQLKAVVAGESRTQAFVQAMRDYELLELLSVDLSFEDGSGEQLTGFYGIDGKKLSELGAKALKTLQDKGYLLPCILAHASLSRLGDLVERRNKLTK